MDCLICMGLHHSKDCNERKPQHCTECHMFIRYCSDHNPVCENKHWVYDVYTDLYVKTPLERCNIGFNCDFRFYQNEVWRKPVEGIDAYSTGNGIFFRFKTDKDIAVLSNGFVHARILVVVKDTNGTFNQKLVLMTSTLKMMVATLIDEPFNRTKCAQEGDTSLILAMSGENSPSISISLFPKSGLARHHEVRYDNETKTFQIPDELKIDTVMSLAAAAQQCTTVAVYEEFKRSFEVAVNQQQHSAGCFECHIPVKRISDHAQQCGSKWYISPGENVYVKIPTIRCVLRFEIPFRLLMDGKFIEIKRDGFYFSRMADTLFKISKSDQIELFTTGFTRIRIPIVVKEDGRTNIFKEKMILMTSADRTIVCANGARQINPNNSFDTFKHNTPLVLCIAGDIGHTVHVEVHSSGANVNRYQIPWLIDENRADRNIFQIPRELDIASKVFDLNQFDADLPQKKQNRNEF